MSFTYHAGVQYKNASGRFANLTNTATITAWHTDGGQITSPAPTLTNITTGVYIAEVSGSTLQPVLFKIVPHTDDQTNFDDVAVWADVIVPDIMGYEFETNLTLANYLRASMAVLANLTTGGGTNTLTFKNFAGSGSRIVATVDSEGNRTNLEYSLE